jgi:hypothetical protein
VNFSNSKLYGVHVERNFIEGATEFLHCKVGNFPFLYLEFPVRANPRRAST